MPDQATPTADVTATEQTASSENQGASERPKSIPIPTDKWGELNRKVTAQARELEELRRSGSSEHLTKDAKASGLDPESEKALDLIADRVDSRNDGLRDDLDRLNFDRRVADLKDSGYAEDLQDDIAEELGRLGRANPRSKRTELLDRAIDNAILSAVKSGKWGQKAEDDALVKAREELADRGRAGTARKSASARDDADEGDVSSMSAQQLVDSGKLDEEFSRIYGNRVRR